MSYQVAYGHRKQTDRRCAVGRRPHDVGHRLSDTTPPAIPITAESSNDIEKLDTNGMMSNTPLQTPPTIPTATEPPTDIPTLDTNITTSDTIPQTLPAIPTPDRPSNDIAKLDTNITTWNNAFLTELDANLTAIAMV